MATLREEVAKVRQVLTNKEEESAESIQKAGADLQKASLKLFEVAYKKVRLQHAFYTHTYCRLYKKYHKSS